VLVAELLVLFSPGELSSSFVTFVLMGEKRSPGGFCPNREKKKQ
jgi:hypothetical protein